jgi:iron-sulfur cluster repair protein YtfE (RIC family)
MPGPISIHAQMAVNEVIQEFPETLRVFHARGIDSCCGGALPLQYVAERHGFDLQDLLAELQAAVTDAREDAVAGR